MKKHSILKVILLAVLFVTVCTWFFPTISYSSGLVEETTRAQLGIFDLFSYTLELFRYFPYVILVVLTTGMFYGVSYKIPAYRELLDKLVALFEGKEKIFLATVMVFIAAIVSVTGLSFGIIFIFPFIISLVLLMGYNKLVAASVTVGSTIVGILGTTLGSDTVYYINAVLGTEVFNEIVTKVILLLIGLVLLVYNVLSYASKTKNNTDKVVELVPIKVSSKEVKVEDKKEKVEDKKEEKSKSTSKSKKSTKEEKVEKKSSKSSTKKDKEEKTTKGTKAKATKKTTSKKTTTKKKTSAAMAKKDDMVVVKSKKKAKVWPYVVMFDLLVIVLAVATFDWLGVCEIKAFDTVLDAVNDFTIKGFPIFAKVLGGVNSFGNWALTSEIPGVIFLATCFLAFIYRVKFNDFLDGIIEGCKKAMTPAVYMLLAYLVLIIVTYNPFQLHFAKVLLSLTDGLNVITMTVVAMISSVLNVESVYVAQSTLPYVTSVVTDSSLYPLIAVIFQAVYGLMMLIAPTSVLLIGTLTYLDISYGQWLKHIWKLFLELLVVLVVLFLVLFLI